MDAKKKHYSDYNGENVVHMATPFAYSIDEDYDYLSKGWLPTALYYFFHTLVILILWPYFRTANGLSVRRRKYLRQLGGCGFVVAANHVHVMDSPMIGCAIGLRRMYCTTITSNFCIPVVRHLVKGLGGVPLGETPGELVRLFSNMETVLKDGKTVLMYPEGVLMPYCKSLRPFKRGAFKMAAEANVPLLPVRITFREPKGIWRCFRKKPFVTVNILPPILPNASLPIRERSLKLQSDCRAAMEGFMDCTIYENELVKENCYEQL